METRGSWRTTAAGWVVLFGALLAGVGNVLLGEPISEDQVTGIYRGLQTVGIETSQELVTLIATVVLGLAGKAGLTAARDDVVTSEEARRASRERGKL